MASVKANPKIAYANNSLFKLGFLEYAFNKHPKTTPIPKPAPPKPADALPAPINLAEDNEVTFKSSICLLYTNINCEIFSNNIKYRLTYQFMRIKGLEPLQ